MKIPIYGMGIFDARVVVNLCARSLVKSAYHLSG